jgi:hypothetical protein
LDLQQRHVRSVRRAFWVAALVLCVLRAWFTRYAVLPGSISYLDVARSVAAGNFHAAVHAYWSPVYPALFAGLVRIFRPSWYTEFPLAHTLNVGIFVVSLLAFEYLWSAVVRASGAEKEDGAPLPAWAVWALGYAAFLSGSLDFITVGVVGPDLLVTVFIFLGAGLVLRMRERACGYGHWALLGIVLGFGYLAKAPMFPLAFVLLAVAYFSARERRGTVTKLGTALFCFLLVSAPLIAALSHAKGRVTFGDSARVNWAWYVNGVSHFRHWQGGPASSDVPTHATRKLLAKPELYEFGGQTPGTYPPWFDPSYWNDGIHPRLEPAQEAAVFGRQSFEMLTYFFRFEPGIICGMLMLLVLSGSAALVGRRLLRQWFLWIPAVAALAMYNMVHTESRFLGGWLVLLWAAALLAIRLPRGDATNRLTGPVVTAVVVAVVATTSAILLLNAAAEAMGYSHAQGRSPAHAVVAAELAKLGVRSGDRVALIGDGSGAYWAHLAGVQIVAEVPNSAPTTAACPSLDFWTGTPDVQGQAMRLFAGVGARAVVTEPLPFRPPAGWQEIGSTGRYIHWLIAEPRH